MTAQTTDLAEDLEALSAFEFQTALAQCVDCTDYHALIGYARLAHVNNGLRTDGDAIISELRGLGRPGLRVLIAGAADAGLLALAARGSLEFSPRITVADRCATPLAVCRRYATARGFAIETVQADLSNTALNGEFDAILAHNVLGYLPKARHLPFLRNLAQSLAKDGTFIFFCRVPAVALTGIVYRTGRADMISALTAKGIALPEDEAAFRRRIEHLDAAENTRDANIPSLQDIETNVTAAGFRIREHVAQNDRLSQAKKEGSPKRAITHMFLLSRAG